MNIVEAERRPLTDLDRTRVPVPVRGAQIVEAPAIIRVDGRIATVVVPLGTARLGEALSLPLPWQGGSPNSQEARLAGFQPKFMAWGFSPPVPLRRRYGCSVCSLDREQPGLVAQIRAQYKQAWDAMCVAAPLETTNHAERVTSAILSDWLVGEYLPFTSGVVNHTAALPYHRDSGNLRDTWSLQVTCRRRVDGGLLHLPELGVWLECNDGDALFFPGQSELHGVTPLRRQGRGAYRFTLVAYAKAQMRRCSPRAEESARAAVAATESNRRKAEA